MDDPIREFRKDLADGASSYVGQIDVSERASTERDMAMESNLYPHH